MIEKVFYTILAIGYGENIEGLVVVPLNKETIENIQNAMNTAHKIPKETLISFEEFTKASMIEVIVVRSSTIKTEKPFIVYRRTIEV